MPDSMPDTSWPSIVAFASPALVALLLATGQWVGRLARGTCSDAPQTSAARPRTSGACTRQHLVTGSPLVALGLSRSSTKATTCTLHGERLGSEPKQDRPALEDQAELDVSVRSPRTPGPASDDEDEG